jgi:hypothetical protein
MILLRFPQRSVWWIVAPWAEFFSPFGNRCCGVYEWGLPPLQRYYLAAYRDCSERQNPPASTTQVE